MNYLESYIFIVNITLLKNNCFGNSDTQNINKDKHFGVSNKDREENGYVMFQSKA